MLDAQAVNTDRFTTLSGSFGGIPAAQCWADFMMWEILLNQHPEMVGIVEIGTWKGGFSAYLYAQARARDMFFRTFDVVAPEKVPVGFEKVDVFAQPERVFDWLDKYGSPKILLCDGGNKPREVRLFAPRLPRGSIVVVHDWGDEIGTEDIPEFLDMLYEDVCVEIGSMSRVFTL